MVLFYCVNVYVVLIMQFVIFQLNFVVIVMLLNKIVGLESQELDFGKVLYFFNIWVSNKVVVKMNIDQRVLMMSVVRLRISLDFVLVEFVFMYVFFDCFVCLFFSKVGDDIFILSNG